MARGKQIKAYDAASVAALVHKYAVKISDRENGDGADWPMLAEAMLQSAFVCIDKAKNDPRTVALLRKVEDGTYNRLAAGASFEADAKPGMAAPPAKPGRASEWNAPRPK